MRRWPTVMVSRGSSNFCRSRSPRLRSRQRSARFWTRTELTSYKKPKRRGRRPDARKSFSAFLDGVGYRAGKSDTPRRNDSEVLHLSSNGILTPNNATGIVQDRRVNAIGKRADWAD